MSFHAGNIEKCDRLQKIFTVLADYQWHTNREIFDRTGVHAYSTGISEIRHNGYPVESRAVKGQRGLHEYRMLRPVNQAA